MNEIIPTMIVLAFYFTPTFIAFFRGHTSRWAIMVLNVLFGWTIFMWFWSLIWALANKGVSQTVIVNNNVGRDV